MLKNRGISALQPTAIYVIAALCYLLLRHIDGVFYVRRTTNDNREFALFFGKHNDREKILAIQF
jgi:hypothetical protein